MRELLLVAAAAAWVGCAGGEQVLEIEVCAAGVERVDAIAEAQLELSEGERVQQATESGRAVRFQADEAPNGGLLLTFELPGRIAADACRTVEARVSSDESEPTEERRTQVQELEDYQGEKAFQIETERATYVYHIGGSGLASLIDREGNDWISYRPEGGFEGDYRGIPNIAPPNFHPGRPEGKKPSLVLHHGALKTTVLSETEDGQWRLRWDFFPNHARMTLLSKGPEPYWLLYEGTPGGKFDPDTDYWLSSAGERMPMPSGPEHWKGRLPDPQWAYFVDSVVERGLFLALHEPDDHWDEFWHRGAGGMTVFGFGRGPKPQWQYLEHSPAHLTIGLLDETEFSAAKTAIESAWRPLEVTVR